jgi:chitin disaccharide deacetylase
MTGLLIHERTMRNPDVGRVSETGHGGLIINADDWGRNEEVTDRTLECLIVVAVSSVSAMVFMEDSERAADLARRHDVDTGLHLNLTTAFSAPSCPSPLRERQQKLARFLRANSLCPAIYHPGLAGTFEYVVKTQLDEYSRLYNKPAARIDGHHHMHLCANVQFQRLLPAGTIVRRNFSFGPKEKSAVNRFYRRRQDRRLAGRHPMTDFFFSLPPMDVPGRLERIFGLARNSSVEVETHPVNRDEYEFLTGGELVRQTRTVGIARGYAVEGQGEVAPEEAKS